MRPLSQEFYSNVLPANCPTLQGLTLFNVSLDLSFLLKLKFLYRIDLCSSDYGLVERLFSNLAYLRYLAFHECSDVSRPSLMSMKKNYRLRKVFTKTDSDDSYDEDCEPIIETIKGYIYEVYDGQKCELDSDWEPVEEFESFESFVKFAQEFTGF